jgi:PAS domain S-box-containing protein
MGLKPMKNVRRSVISTSSSHTLNQNGDNVKTRMELVQEVKKLQDKILFLTDELRRRDEHPEAKKVDGQAQINAPVPQSHENKANTEEPGIKITERRRAEEALLDSEERYRSLFNSIDEGFCIIEKVEGKATDPVDFRYIEANPAFTLQTGISGMVGRTIREVVPDGHEEWINTFNAVLETGIPIRFERYLETQGRMLDLYAIRVRDKTHRRIAVLFKDITERKQADAALRESERNARMRVAELTITVESALDGIVFYDKNGKIIRHNEIATRYFANTDDYDIALQERAARYRWLYPDGTPIKVEDTPAYRALRGETVRDFEIILEKGSDRLWVTLSAAPLRTDSGEIFGAVSTARDITGHKRAEKALQDSEKRQRLAARAAMVGIYSYNFISGESYWSPELKAQWGYKPDEPVQLDEDQLIRCLHPDDRQMFLNAMTVANDPRGNGEMDLEYRLKRRDGSIRWLLVHGHTEFIGDGESRRPYCAHGATVDITRIKLAEEALSQLAAIVESSRDAIISKTLDGVITSLNMGAERVYGYRSKDVIGKPISILAPRDRPDEIPRLLEKIKRGEAFIYFDTKRLRKDGKLIDVAITLSPVKNMTGQIIGIATIARDITERKRAEEELLSAKMEAELYLDLMGHDVNNMHQVAMGYLELAQDMVPVNDEQREFLERPQEMMLRSAHLIDNVRKLQTLKDGLLATERVDVRKVLKDVYREYDVVPDRSITFNVYGNYDYRVLANELLYDVFSNIVHNAIKHSGDDGTNIIMGLDRTRENGSHYYRVIVEDNGPGISDEFKDKIFNRLLRGTTKAKGMGLGLYLVKRLVESYNGRVWAEDRVKGDHTKGARFVVMLPVAE